MRLHRATKVKGNISGRGYPGRSGFDADGGDESAVRSGNFGHNAEPGVFREQPAKSLVGKEIAKVEQNPLASGKRDFASGGADGKIPRCLKTPGDDMQAVQAVVGFGDKLQRAIVGRD